MAVFAHPDDESFGTGGTLARYGADPEVRVVLVCATRGEAGEISDPELATPDRLGEVREQELRCATEALGVDQLHILGYRDSGMAGTRENLDPRSLAMAKFDEVVGKIVAHIRREQPDVIMTFDQTGGYGHPDHVAVHYHTRAAFSAAADPLRYPEQIEAGLAVHQAKKLYYTAIPRRFFLDMVDKMKELGHEIPERYLQRLEGPFGLPDFACTTDVYVEEYWDVKQAAVQCHATQLNPDSFFAALPPEIMRELQAWECFQLAESLVSTEEDHDLFIGLR
ncbi:MAG: PIG-L family deacetylase [Anaerolineae bacterium]|nr:PIG-L family deacetylase [Anaerolineae bacterium]